MSTPNIQPIKTKEYNVKQSKYPHVGKLPTRSILLGPSSSGKTVLLTNMILDIYRDLFQRIYIFSPSITIDTTWTPVKHYIEKEMSVDIEKEKMFFDEYKHEDLQQIIDTQNKVIEHQKQKIIKLYFKF